MSSNKKSVDNNLTMLSGNWTFENIEKKFDSHILKSIPFYNEIHNICINIFTIKLEHYFKVYYLS